ncbi:MAG TPA: IS66 family transposase [Thermoleophilia bacterium]|nr:IS66 family transposase [Thermoleophilia bacterium]
MLARVEVLEVENAKLRAENVELRARLNQNSSNSSKPPSSDAPGTPRAAKKPPSGRKPGGQPGHEKRVRELLPVQQVDRVVPLAPKKCGHCHSRRLTRVKGAPWRHQQIEVPRPKPEVTEFQCFSSECEDCGAITEAALPAEAVPVFGAHLTALAGALVVQYRLSKRLAQRLLSDVLGVDLSLGMLPKLGAEVGEALAAPVAEAEAHVREQMSANADETGWYEGKKDGRHRRAWLWVFATAFVVVFRISFSRGGEVVKQVLGHDFTGFLCTDRWSGYNWFDLGLRQVCWSHLTRDFQGFIDRGGVGGRIGEALMAQRDKLFRWWSQVRDGTLSRDDFARRSMPLRREVGRLLRDAASRAKGKTKGMAAEMLKVEEAFWTFIDTEGVEPTNNFAERCIRHGVMYRKTSFGTQSSAGSRFVERMLTVHTSLNLQQRNVLDFVTQAVLAHRTGAAAPSLLPNAVAQLAAAA